MDQLFCRLREKEFSCLSNAVNFANMDVHKHTSCKVSNFLTIESPKTTGSNLRFLPSTFRAVDNKPLTNPSSAPHYGVDLQMVGSRSKGKADWYVVNKFTTKR